MACQVNIRQGQRCKGPAGILGQAAIAHLGKAPQSLDHGKHVFHPCPDFGLVAVLCPLGFIHLACFTNALIRKILCLWRLAPNQFLLAGIGAVAIDASLLPMQQMRQRVLVMNIGRRHHSAMRQPALAVYPDM